MAEPRGKGTPLAVLDGGAERKKKKRQPAGWKAFTEGGSLPWWLVLSRVVMVLAFAATIPVILGVHHGNRLLWTCAIASLPLFWVLGGYHLWRRICPLAITAQLGRYVGLGGRRKVGAWLAANYLYLQLALMMIALSLRLVATNGSHIWLSGFLGAVVLSAILVGLLYTGKTWCNYICPVGMVEKIYTEPSRLMGEQNSQCSPCTACKKHCPDIDLEHGYWKELNEGPRRVAYFAWPGIVLGFYAYFYLVSGSWDYYFSGIWSYEIDQASRWSEPGFTFLPQIPIVAAAPLTLIAFGLASYLVFRAGEAIALRRHGTRTDDGAVEIAEADRDRTHHRALVLAGFAAFNTFYFFGGQPTLRAAPSWVVTGFGVLVVFASAAIFFRRWPRSEADHVQERFAQKLVKKWQWGDKPEGSLQDLYLLHNERTKEREARLSAYKETVRELVADGVVTKGELVILDSLRAQLGVSEKDHDKIMAELSDEERQLFDPQYQGSVEMRLQREQYDRDLERAVILAARAGKEPDAVQLEMIRDEHQMSAEEHAEALAALRSADGPLARIYREEIAKVMKLADATAAARGSQESGDPSSSLSFTRHLCRWRGEHHVDRALTLLAAIGDRDMIAQARAGLVSDDLNERAQAVQYLRAAAASDLTHPLAHAVDRLLGEHHLALESSWFAAIADDVSPYVRAAVSLVLSRFDDETARAPVIAATEDDEALVREAAYRSLGSRGRLTRELMQRALSDPEQRVRQAAVRAVTGTSGQMPAVNSATALAQTIEGVGNSGLYATLDANARMESLTTLEKMMLLRNVPMFEDLEPDDLEEITYIASEERFAPGDALCREGEAGSAVFLVVSGQVRVFAGGGQTPEVTLAELGRGACIGEMSAFDDAPRSATVTATNKTRALMLPGDEFKNLLLARPAIAQGILGELVGRMRKLIAARSSGS